MKTKANIKSLVALTRLDKPVGIFLLLWPSLFSLWVATNGRPGRLLLIKFIVGTIIARSSGCIINDIADRDFDKHVTRTKDRPLTSGQLSLKDALATLAVLGILGISIALSFNLYAKLLLLLAGVLATVYPFCKRFFAMPQLVLGICFAMPVLIIFAEVKSYIPYEAWIIFYAVAIWTLAYDTEYAMADAPDDIKIGIQSTAILFQPNTILAVLILFILTIGLFTHLGYILGMGYKFYLGIIGAWLCFCYQLYLIKQNKPELCFKAFLQNNVFGACIFIALFCEYLTLN